MLPTETLHLCLGDVRTDVDFYSQLGVNVVCLLITLRCASVIKGSCCNSSSQSWKWMKDSSENKTPGCSWTLKPLNAGPHFLCPCLHFCLPPSPTFLLPEIFEEWAKQVFPSRLCNLPLGSVGFQTLHFISPEWRIFWPFFPIRFLPGNKR